MSMNPGWEDEKILTIGDMKNLIKNLDDNIEIKISDNYGYFIIHDTGWKNKNTLLLEIEIE